jgi:hypothetical protein
MSYSVAVSFVRLYAERIISILGGIDHSNRLSGSLYAGNRFKPDGRSDIDTSRIEFTRVLSKMFFSLADCLGTHVIFAENSLRVLARQTQRLPGKSSERHTTPPQPTPQLLSSTNQTLCSVSREMKHCFQRNTNLLQLRGLNHFLLI